MLCITQSNRDIVSRDTCCCQLFLGVSLLWAPQMKFYPPRLSRGWGRKPWDATNQSEAILKSSKLSNALAQRIKLPPKVRIRGEKLLLGDKQAHFFVLPQSVAAAKKTFWHFNYPSLWFPVSLSFLHTHTRAHTLAHTRMRARLSS